jgi:hypothetical protein
MRRERYLMIVGFISALMVVAVAVASCGGEATPSTQSSSTTIAPTTITGTGELDGIRVALEASEDVADYFEIVDYMIMPEWAGAVVSASMADDARVLLTRGAAGWEVVAVFSDMSRQELLDYGTPEEIAAFLASDGSVPSAAGLSAESIAYAEELGGTSHEGETIYAVIGASVETESEAQKLLEEARPSFGDMQSYFIVQRSDNFDGMEPGWWVVIEAYYADPDGDQLDFSRRGFPEAYVKQVVVQTSDPIPVYDDT